MDNLTHTFIGWTLARAGLDRFGPWATPVLLVAANLPDAEIPLLFGDKATYLNYHRGISHSFVGFAAEALLVSVVVCAAAWFVRRKLPPEYTPATPPPKFLAVMFVALIGLLSHLLLDFFNTYGVRPLLPFDSRWFYGDMLFLFDPWSWLILGAGLFIGSKEHLRLVWVALALAALATVVFGFHRNHLSAQILAVWCVLFALLLPLKFVSPRWFTARRAACGSLALWSLYLALAFFASGSATARATEFYLLNSTPPQRILASSASAAPAAPWRHTVALQTENDLFIYNTDEFTGSVELRKHLSRNLACAANPVVQNTREYQTWLAFARHPCCSCGQDTITLFDGRYGALAKNPSDDWTAFEVPQPK